MTLHPLTSKGGAFVSKLGLAFKEGPGASASGLFQQDFPFLFGEIRLCRAKKCAAERYRRGVSGFSRAQTPLIHRADRMTGIVFMPSGENTLCSDSEKR